MSFVDNEKEVNVFCGHGKVGKCLLWTASPTTLYVAASRPRGLRFMTSSKVIVFAASGEGMNDNRFAVNDPLRFLTPEETRRVIRAWQRVWNNKIAPRLRELDPSYLDDPIIYMAERAAWMELWGNDMIRRMLARRNANVDI